MTDNWLLTTYLLLSIADYRIGSQQLAIGYIALSRSTIGSVSQPANLRKCKVRFTFSKM